MNISTKESNYPQIFDGFSYGGSFGVRPLPLNYYAQVGLKALEPLRLVADSYRPRWHVVPNSFFDPANTNSANIAVGKTFFWQIQVKPGSYLWAMNFSALLISAEEEPSIPGYSVMVNESNTGLALFDIPIDTRQIATTQTGNADANARPPLQILAEPKLILSPGQLDISISNDDTPGTLSSVSGQLALYFMEPK